MMFAPSTRIAAAGLALLAAGLSMLPAGAQTLQLDPNDPLFQPPATIGEPPVDDQQQPGLDQPQPGDQPPAVAQPQLQAPAPNRIANPVAVFAGLDKITGRIISFDVYIDETVQFGALQVTPRVCYSRPPTEEPQTDAFVEVDEITLNRKIRRIFGGWMFASSPGLHAVDNAVYDVWLTDCKMKSDVAPPKR
jgi:hypothetical protein